MAPYRILKLRSGESIITRIVAKKNGKFTVENPMLMKITSLTDPFSGYRRDILTLSNWLEYTQSKNAIIPEDWVAIFLTPDEQAVRLYESEVNRPEISIEDLIKQQKEQIDKMEQMDISQIMMSFAIDENVFKKLVEEGILDQEMLEELDDMDGSHDDLEVDTPPRNGEEEDFGNHWRDWSSDLRDYL